MNSSEVDDVLRTLIETCEDAACGIGRCAGNADQMELQLLMTQRAATWQRWAGELRTLCVGGAAPRALQRPGMAAMPSRDSDEALLAQCERGEQIALQRYRDALETEVPRIVRAVLQRHVDGIQASRAQMRSLHAVVMLAPAWAGSRDRINRRRIAGA